MASLSVSGLVPMSAAIAGSEVAITVEIHVLHEESGGHDQRDDALLVDHDGLVMKIRRKGGLAAYHRRSAGTIADQRIAPKSCVTTV